ncbi:MAG TPA: hypothetical protein VIY86_07665, partial [Pirellulaceae bacterium]
MRSKRSPSRVFAIEVLEARNLWAAVSAWYPRGAGGGGAFYSPSLNPHAPQQFYVTSDMSELFFTADEGDHWRARDFRGMQGNAGSEVQFTHDPLLRFVLDRRPQDLVDGAWPTRSTDGGRTWTQLAGDPTGGEAFSLHVDFANPNRIVLSDYQRFYVSLDGGNSFSLKYTAPDTVHVSGVIFNGTTIYVGTKQGLRVSQDGGLSFLPASFGGIPAGEAIVSLAGAIENGITRLLAVTLAADDVYGGVTGAEHGNYQGIYRWTTGAAQWSRVTTGITTGSQPFFVAMAGNDMDTAYVAGGSDQGVPRIFKTSDGGLTWLDVFRTTNNANIETGWAGSGGDRDWSYGEYALGFAVASNDPNRLLVTDLGFVHFSEDGGTSWRVVNVDPADRNPAGQPTPRGQAYRTSGLDNDSVWGLTWSDADTLVASASDIRGMISRDGGTSWSFDYTGHSQNTMYQAVRHFQGKLYAATATVHDMYQTTRLRDTEIDAGAGRVLVSSDQGTSWQILHDFGKVVTGVSLDPTNPNRLYAAVAHSTVG